MGGQLLTYFPEGSSVLKILNRKAGAKMVLSVVLAAVVAVSAPIEITAISTSFKPHVCASMNPSHF